ncbi:efflux RND transporter permease subunit [Synoicihabitans lomoniglobus]|uniref:Efflux RND transporter permease subunit n=1 Tax=Synoicihabitans lomoniglobus TaxID=2909285 RepID=A0AAF0CNE7_9BACT|nr:efflux RND transporter permease subunit [Opitutaceae bacterium LMO-M01]WED65418.1 efflux RND transporter permease subunit [Opitutaceae bacterium LMO-M01]
MSKRDPIAYSLPRFSVTRPVTVVMILFAILVVGFIANMRIPVALFPAGMEENALGVFVSYPNASARDIEEKITRPVEDMVGTVSGVKEINSYLNNGRNFTRVTFQSSVDLRVAYSALRDRMDRLMPEMPDDLDMIHVRRWDENDIPIIFMVLKLPPQVEDKAYVMETVITPAVQRVDGVGNVDTWGVDNKEIRIDIIEERLRSHRIDPNRLVQLLRGQNFDLSSGFVMEGDKKVYVRSLGRFRTVDEIKELVVDPEHRITLGEVAEVRYRARDRERGYHIDGQPAIGMEITRESSGNIEQISTEVRATLDELSANPQLAGMTYSVFWDQGDHVRESINNLKSTGMWGGLFAASVIFAFLRAPRMTGILTLAIPLSLLCTLIALYFMGWSLNMATMMGLLLSVGLVVDNAIVIVENIYRRRQEGVVPDRASIMGAGEVGLAVTLATLTTVVVFLPLILMSDDQEFSFWMLRIGTPVITSLLASLFIALVFVPLAATRFSRGTQRAEPRSIGWLRRHYTIALGWVLNHRLEAGLLVILAFCSIVIPLGGIEQDRNDGGNEENTMRFFYDLPTGNSFEESEAFMLKVEDYFAANLDTYNFASIESRYGRDNGRIQARFKKNEPTEWYDVVWNDIMIATGQRQPHMTRPEIEKHVKDNFPTPPGITMRTRRWGDVGGIGRVTITLYGDDTTTLMELSEKAADRIRTIPGLQGVDTSMERGGSELQVQINRERARELGVEPREVSGSITYSMRGMEVGRYYDESGRDVRIQVQLEDAENKRIDDLRAMTFMTDNGREVPLESVASLNVEKTLGQIARQNRLTTLNVTARTAMADTNRVFNAIDEVMADFEMPRGYRWDKGVRWIRLQESNEAQKFAMILSVTFVFLLMGVLFESFILPLAVIIAVPFSFLGVYWTLFLTNTKMSMMAMIGMVILIGVVVNNAIVLVDLTNRLREEGVERMAALLKAGQHRLRPILMTTCTTVCGLIPMALGNSQMIGMPYSPMGRAMIGGLIASTVLTLLVVPLFYILLDDLRNYAGAVARSAFSPRAPKQAEPVSGR